jgi:ribosomal protein S12 methylthiotransferase accessory factor YcaO
MRGLPIMEIDVVRKDASPPETIGRIHAVLDSLGFRPEHALVQRWTAAGHCHSCQIRFRNYPLLYANGKGVTDELAYASALAEFMERLQCWVDGFFTRAGNIHHLAPFFAASRRTCGELTLDAPELMAGDLAALWTVPADVVPCLPFVDVFGGQVVELPFDFFHAMTGSNGMCAGNTAEEAISHGICEIFERYVIRLVESGHVAGLPTLPLDSLPVRSEVLARQLRSLQAAGIEVMVKDATLGGAFPVVAAVLADRDSNTCHVSFGSDPVFDVALSRCLTEAFQGCARLFRLTPPAGGHLRPLDTFNNLETLLDSVRPDVGRPRAEAAFVEVTTNRDALRFLQERTQRAGRRLYVRDFSVFGFPAYYVFVEELSPLRELLPAQFRSLPRHFETVRATIFRLAWATRDEIAHAAGVLFEEMTAFNPTLEARFLADVLHAPTAYWIGLRPLLVMMLLEAGELERARAIVGWAPLSAPELAPEQRGSSLTETPGGLLQAYRSLRRAVLRDSDILKSFHELFGDRASGDVATDGQEGILRLPVPCCQNVYACPSCPCRAYCRLEEWYRLARQLRARASGVEQERLLRTITARPRRRSHAIT